jgi:hypothetical protein
MNDTLITPEWYNPKLSKRLNIPNDNYIKTETNINFGHIKHDSKYNTHYKFLNNKRNLNFKPLVFESDPNRMKEIKKITTQLSNETNKDRKKGLTTKLERKNENLNKPTISKKITIFPTVKQKNIISGWIKECASVYNKCVDLYTDDKTYFNKGYEKSKLEVFEELYGDDNKPCPYDILTDEVRIFCSNLKSCK